MTHSAAIIIAGVSLPTIGLLCVFGVWNIFTAIWSKEDRWH